VRVDGVRSLQSESLSDKMALVGIIVIFQIRLTEAETLVQTGKSEMQTQPVSSEATPLTHPSSEPWLSVLSILTVYLSSCRHVMDSIQDLVQGTLANDRAPNMTPPQGSAALVCRGPAVKVSDCYGDSVCCCSTEAARDNMDVAVFP
jgi:hypothetical protein